MIPTAIVSNHPRETYRSIDLGDIPFHHLPVTKDTKPAGDPDQESVKQTEADLVVLARYMQVLSAEMAASWPAAASISITPSCPASTAPGPTTRP